MTSTTEDNAVKSWLMQTKSTVTLRYTPRGITLTHTGQRVVSVLQVLVQQCSHKQVQGQLSKQTLIAENSRVLSVLQHQLAHARSEHGAKYQQEP